MGNQPKSLKEAVDNLNEAFRALCITAFEMDVIMDRLAKIIRNINHSPNSLASRKPYQSPYAIFDKFRKKKR